MKPFLWSSQKGFLNIIKLLYETNKIDINCNDEEKWTALHWASNNNHYNVMEYLLKLPDIDINLKQKDGIYLLFFSLQFTLQLKMEMTNV